MHYTGTMEAEQTTSEARLGVGILGRVEEVKLDQGRLSQNLQTS